MQGYSGGPLYDGIHLANTSKIIVVTTNYRLNAFGFLYTGTEDSTSIDGNYGIQDQRLAMKFVKENIASFGGDPDHVTITGQSAGAQSVATHLISENSAPYFDSAMIFSNPMGLPFRDNNSAISWGRLVASKAACANESSSLKEIEKCLRALDAETILKGEVEAHSDILAELSDLLHVLEPWGPIIGTKDCPTQPLYAMANRTYIQHDKPIITGTVTNEGWMFIYEAFGFKIPSFALDILLPLVFGEHAGSKIKSKYPVPPSMENDTRPLLATIATDGLFHCPVRHAMQSLSNASTQNVWIYHFDHVSSFSKQEWGRNYSMCYDNVCHAADLIYWFKMNVSMYGVNYTESESKLANSMGEYTGNFVHHHVPGSPASEPLSWPAYNSTSKGAHTMMHLKTPSNQLENAPMADICDYWDNEVTYSYVAK